ncbi:MULTISPECIES: superoxide dismutase, Ni [Streptomycetaceae]|uniref:Superoxide dismutase, Ni n=2 Tax=Kitasatospora TaxID=2063 RepID=A0ABW0WY94_9ACTN|nr:MULTISPECIES: superoxide dismutase, Ni [Streptomycetaceae]KJY37470.1 superoxide dismutase [Streptomyces sp. NRRL S-495]KOV24141.1 superoxide dismutase [Streptomyces sp. XY431]MCX4687680.1 superoxide dismutase, Ni [Kitasatospora purpeofusca]MCX4754826.1 superoxide dismutase, Ni [Kitasatospora purpeofusca]MED7954437.1 superoxide dismutase, Ni [Streptomyces sp. BE303]
MFSRLFAPRATAHAHCDLPCGVYDPAQARIEAESVKATQEKYQANEDAHFRARAVIIKEQRAEAVKHHISVLWSDYFKAPHFEKYPQLHQLINDTLKAASAAKASTDPATGQALLDLIAEVDKIFWETKQG